MYKKIFILMVLCFSMTACGTTRRVVVEPGPPGLRPWQRPYTVDGERYVPLLEAWGYREEGLASWYGEEEHGKPTSNGEVFDMYKMTAAHKTLPLGSHIRVTNKTNGRQAVVRVNDRGPFIPGRVLDLSYQAAKEIDMVDEGVIPVAFEVLSSGPTTASKNIGTAAGGTFTLQVAAFSDGMKARQVSEKLKKTCTSSDVETVQTGSTTIYRVHAGRFRSREDAEAAKGTCVPMEYADAFVVSLQ